MPIAAAGLAANYLLLRAAFPDLYVSLYPLPMLKYVLGKSMQCALQALHTEK